MNKLPELLLVDKPKHWTSNDVIRKIKSITKVKKIGHAGTLDPLATGLLIVGLNSGTKLLSNLITSSKKYFVVIHFGYYTNTLDSEGEVLDFKNTTISFLDLVNVLDGFVSNKYLQTPPKFSAILINGVKAYKLARNNIDFEIKSKEVQLFSYKIINFANNELMIEIDVSKGFYVRSFAYDLGLKLNSYGNVAELKRISIGDFLLADAYKIEEIYDLYNQ